LAAVDRVLTGHRVEDEVDLVRGDGGVDLAQLGHELGVDRQPAGGVEDDDVLPGLLRLRDRGPRDGNRGALGDLAVRRDLARIGVDGVAVCSPSTRSCSTAAGRCKSTAASNG
jgi:hypothetical protein